MTVTREEDKPWKTDLARKAAQRRDQVGLELEDVIKKATSFEDALRQAVEMMKKRFARYSSVTAYVADGEELAVHTALERPQGPERVASTGGVLADAAQGTNPTVFTDLSASPVWAPVGLTSGSAMVAPVRTDAGLWAILEVWSDFRGAFSPQDAKLLGRVAQALAKKTPGGLTTVSLRGVIPPLVTPFHADGGLDLEAFSASLEALAAHDFVGFLVLGSNGEAASLDEDEKLLLVAAARRTVPGRFLLVGSGLESTRGTIALTRKVADLGADAVLVLTPCYYKGRMTAEALRRHFEAVADASPVPVYLYSVPAFTGIAWPMGLAETLAAHPGIRGLKESSGDVGLLGRVVASVPAGFEVACGNAPVFYPALCVGAAGGILAVANCAPQAVLKLHRAFCAGDHATARRLQDAIAPLATAVTVTHGVAGLKLTMGLVGLRGGTVRAPLLPAAPALLDEIRPLLEAVQAAI